MLPRITNDWSQASFCVVFPVISYLEQGHTSCMSEQEIDISSWQLDLPSSTDSC